MNAIMDAYPWACAHRKKNCTIICSMLTQNKLAFWFYVLWMFCKKTFSLSRTWEVKLMEINFEFCYRSGFFCVDWVRIISIRRKRLTTSIYICEIFVWHFSDFYFQQIVDEAVDSFVWVLFSTFSAFSPYECVRDPVVSHPSTEIERHRKECEKNEQKETRKICQIFTAPSSGHLRQKKKRHIN